jgi:hypothetical protein
VESFEVRTVPLGGVRGIEVHRALPQRALPTVGAWCFLDEFGPTRHPMNVLPHPHIGLQTVTWTFDGEVRHRDSLGSDVVIRPGQLNLMTSGRGVAHSEFSRTGNLHGLQMWVALPSAEARSKPAFAQHTELPVYEEDGLRARVFLGTLGEVTSPATTFSPLVGAELGLSGATAVPLRPDFEYAVLLIDGDVEANGIALRPGRLYYAAPGHGELTLASSPHTARLILLGGLPFPDDLVMWWNFVGRDHDEVAAARADWEAADIVRFGPVTGHGAERIPAPVLPNVRLAPRRRPGRG